MTKKNWKDALEDILTLSDKLSKKINKFEKRFHKVANIIGNTMKYHPHGDAAIGDALVNIGQKGFLVETQGNWGDSTTGDKAAAPRYIESKLSDISIDVVFKIFGILPICNSSLISLYNEKTSGCVSLPSFTNGICC